ncbi:STAS domain-containing protein [Blastococcus sp. MG754426]|uniref:MEDS domain-containing protein n=1 Tax=Blastococcus sp. MG754426 TaxID=2570317 RepID=UPI001F1F551D|nr:MEDS domain-containing protein [Blastococcus sp. MG754426]MCF6508963.1 STAS domain-containing protein [Blastococcus sp. MG754426]MCF6513668.1 STAS domain-containing protein [Blastococcus sp. MG754427]
MRVHGSVRAVPPPRARDHVCWLYRDGDELDAAVLASARGGLGRGERLLAVGERVVAAVHRAGGALGGVDALVADGTLRLLPLQDAYAGAGSFDAGRQRQFYDRATRAARAEGYRGLRVLADVSPLAADPATRAELARWEHVADEYIAQGPGMSALCAYDATLPAAALDAVTAVHPQVHAPSAPPAFRAFFDRDRVVVAGDVDLVGAERLSRVLAGSPVEGGTRTLDLSGLGFADVAGCRAIARWVRSLAGSGVRVELRDAPPLVRRAWPLLGFDRWAPVVFTSA